MTAVEERTETPVAEAPAEVVEAPAEKREFTTPTGAVTIVAATEEEALRKYKRLVRSEGLKAKDDMGWCVDGTNNRLKKLGVRLIGEGVPMAVNVTIVRKMYLRFDAEDEAEAMQMIADGDDYLTTLAQEHLNGTLGKAYKVGTVELAQKHTGPYKVGDPDETLNNSEIRAAMGGTAHMCETYDPEGAGRYCTKQRGHVTRGDRQHAYGNGMVIVQVWDAPKPRRRRPGEDPEPIIGENLDDASAAHCNTRWTSNRGAVRGQRLHCSRPRGHGGTWHVAAAGRRIVDYMPVEDPTPAGDGRPQVGDRLDYGRYRDDRHSCAEQQSDGGYTCSLPPGHPEAYHVAATSADYGIVAVWGGEAPPVEPDNVFHVGDLIPRDQWHREFGGGSCGSQCNGHGGFRCNLLPGHDGYHAGTFHERVIKRMWDDDGTMVETDGE